MGKKLKRKPLSLSVKAVRWKGLGLWREGFKENVSFEFRVEKSTLFDIDIAFFCKYRIDVVSILKKVISKHH